MRTFQINLILPAEIDHLKIDIEQFIMEMVAKLYHHKDKGHWEDVDIPNALHLLHGEVYELEEAITEKDYQAIHKEAADVANYALIISSVLRRQHREEQLELFDDK